MSILACVPALHAAAFGWLGGITPYQRLLRALPDVRGLDAVLVLATEETIKQARSETAARVVLVPKQRTVVLKQLEPLRGLLSWLCESGGLAAKYERLVIVSPLTPFLPVTRIEECLAIADQRNGMVRTVRLATTLDLNIGVNVPAQLPVDGICVVRPLLFGSPTASGWAVKITSVPVDAIEAIDVSDQAQARLAQAWLDSVR